MRGWWGGLFWTNCSVFNDCYFTNIRTQEQRLATAIWTISLQLWEHIKISKPSELRNCAENLWPTMNWYNDLITGKQLRFRYIINEPRKIVIYWKRLIHCTEILICQQWQFRRDDKREEFKFHEKMSTAHFLDFQVIFQTRSLIAELLTLKVKLWQWSKKHHLLLLWLMRLWIFGWNLNCHAFCDSLMRRKSLKKCFLRHVDVNQDRRTASLIENVRKFVNEFKCGQRLIAQTYDEASVMA